MEGLWPCGVWPPRRPLIHSDAAGAALERPFVEQLTRRAEGAPRARTAHCLAALCCTATSIEAERCLRHICHSPDPF